MQTCWALLFFAGEGGNKEVLPASGLGAGKQLPWTGVR